jgi:hypothetical protein
MDALGRAGGEAGSEWLLTAGQLLSCHDLRAHPWSAVCGNGSVESDDIQFWSETDDPDRRREFVRLLNHCLRAFTRSLGLRYYKPLDCHYFPATPDLKPRSLSYKSLQQNTSRDVFAVYFKKKQPAVVSHYRHAAFTGSFQRHGEEWYLQLTPTYLYTIDGYRVSRFQGELLAGIKRFDRNAAVVGQLVMWAEVLTPAQQLFGEPYPFLQFGKLERFQVNRRIDDAAWTAGDSTESKPSDTDDAGWPAWEES